MNKDERFEKVWTVLASFKQAIEDIEKIDVFLGKVRNLEDKKLAITQRKRIEEKVKALNKEIKERISETLFSKPLEIEKKVDPSSLKPQIHKKKKEKPPEEKLKTKGGKIISLKDISPVELEKETIYRIRRKKEKEKKKKPVKKASEYTKISSNVFSKVSRNLLTKKSFHMMEEDLKKANLEFTPSGYISIILMTTLLSGVLAGFLFFFFLFFNFGATLPIITRATETLNERFIKVFWILFAVPLSTFLMMYIYPSLEKKSAESAIDTELPFATIHMSAISGSMINPIKIFEIIILSNEYPAFEKEFKKMINEINLYGYDFVSALKNTSENSPSKRLSELLNGLATTITSGGDLPKFFEKRAETLLFDYRIEQQKSSKAAETFMDIYISILIAAPMILMLLMMIMKLSGLGISTSVGVLALMIILGVVVVNIFFLSFLHLKKQK